MANFQPEATPPTVVKRSAPPDAPIIRTELRLTDEPKKEFQVFTCRLADGSEALQSTPCEAGMEVSEKTIQPGPAEVVKQPVDVYGYKMVTPLSRKAEALKNRRTHWEAIKLLGPATWATKHGDAGDDHEHPRGEFTLYWRNSPCWPVEITFGENKYSTGYNLGFSCGASVPEFEAELEASFSCTRPDRAKLCK